MEKLEKKEIELFEKEEKMQDEIGRLQSELLRSQGHNHDHRALSEVDY